MTVSYYRYPSTVWVSNRRSENGQHKKCKKFLRSLGFTDGQTLGYTDCGKIMAITARIVEDWTRQMLRFNSTAGLLIASIALRALLILLHLLVACAKSVIGWIASLPPSPQPSPRGEGKPFFSFRASPSTRDCNHDGMTILPLPKGYNCWLLVIVKLQCLEGIFPQIAG